MDIKTIHRLHSKGELERAERFYRKFLSSHPDSAEAHGLLGELYLQKSLRPSKENGSFKGGHWGQAYYHARRAIELGETASNFVSDFLIAARKIGRSKEALQLGIECLTRLHPKWDRLWEKDRMQPAVRQFAGTFCNNLGTLYMAFADYEAAEAVLERGVVYDPADANLCWNLALSRLVREDWTGWYGYEHGFNAGERQVRPYYDEIAAWKGEPLKGKTILVWGEQGVGDEICFAQCLPDVKRDAARVIVDCHPRLLEIFKRSFPGITFVGKRKTHEQGLFDEFDIDYQVPIGSLPLQYRMASDAFLKGPYIKPRRSEVAKWRALAPGFRVGICWRGGSNRTDAGLRSFAPEDILSQLHAIPRDLREDMQVVSLQYGNEAGPEIAAAVDRHGYVVHSYEWAIEDFEQNVDLHASCDLIISPVQTSIHVGGALGIPTWCLTPICRPWKFGPGEGTAWHPSVRQFHQKKPHDWHLTLFAVRTELEKLLTLRRAQGAKAA